MAKNRIYNMIDKTSTIGISGATATYITAEIMPFVSLAIGVATLVYMISKTFYLIKHHGYEVPTQEPHQNKEDHNG